MPVTTTHPEYDLMAPVWEDIRIALSGARAVRNAGPKYLPRLHEQTPEAYASYAARAVWFGATSKTADGWTGIITRKPPTVKSDKALEEFLNDCDRRGTAWSSYLQTIIRDNVRYGRCATLIDWTSDNKPYVTHYTGPQVINWETTRMGGKTLFSFIMIQEAATNHHPATGEPPPDKYSRATYEQWREYRLLGDKPENASVEMILWRRKFQKATAQPNANITTPAPVPEGEDFVEIQRTTLTRRGSPVRQIPIEIHGSGNVPPEQVSKPLLEDLVELNFAHFRASADLWNGRHIAGLPTPWARCFTGDGQGNLTLGTSKAWVSDNKDAMCGMLEMKGDALDAIKEGMEELERQMAALGARAIEAPKKEAEAVGTVALRARAESASLVTVAEQTSRSATQVMLWAAWIQGTHTAMEDKAKDTYTQIPADMTNGKMEATTLTALSAALMNNSISFETYFYNLQAGEMYPDARTMEEEEEAIKQGAPAPPLPELPEGETVPAV